MKLKRKFIFIIVIANVLFLLSLYNLFYYKEASFDNLKKAEVDSNKISLIETDEGTWIWDSKEYDFYSDYKVSLKNKNEIQDFCTILSDSKSKYIDNLKCKNWINIYFELNNKLVHKVTLKYNYSNEVFFEYEDHTYEGKKLESFIKSKNKKI